MRLAGINVDYEEQLEYWFKQVETPGAALDWRVEKMHLSKDKRQIRYNDFLTLDGNPAATVQLPPGQPLDARMGDRPVPRQNG